MPTDSQQATDVSLRTQQQTVGKSKSALVPPLTAEAGLSLIQTLPEHTPNGIPKGSIIQKERKLISTPRSWRQQGIIYDPNGRKRDHDGCCAATAHPESRVGPETGIARASSEAGIA